MSLSEEEFARLQGQILDLRNANYELKGKLDKQVTENNSLREIVQRQKVDLAKNKVQGSILQTISKVGRNQDADQISQELVRLQQKLQQQEEEFKLQNNTLLAEVEKLRVDNNELNKQIEELTVEADEKETLLELRRLQVENATLRKFHNGDNEQTTGENSECASESSLDVEALNEERRIISDQMRDAQVACKSENGKLKSEIEKLQEKVRKKQESVVLLQEEKEHLYKDNTRLQDEIKCMTIEKQKEVTQERERLGAIIDLKSKELEDLKSFSTNRIRELENIVSSLNRETTETMQNSSKQAAELETALRAASDRYDNQCVQYKQLVVTNEDLTAVNESLKSQTADLHNELERAQSDNEELRHTVDDMKTTIGNLTAENGKNAARLRQLEAALEDATALAEKRKSMMEDMASQYSKSMEQLREEAKNGMGSQSELKEELKLCQLQNCELEASQQKVAEEKEALLRLMDQMKQQNAELRAKLAQCEEDLTQTRKEMDSRIDQMQKQNTDSSNELQKELAKAKEELQIQSGAMKKSSVRISELEQQVLDKVEERRIGEQKLVVKLKDLQKVAKQEKQRADKLQAKLQEFLSNAPKLDGHIKTGYDDVYLSVSPARNSHSAAGGAGDGDSLSVSSYGQLSDLPFSVSPNSQMPNNMTLEAALSPGASQSVHVANGCAPEDIQHLFDRVANLQQEKWMLEEKLSHLEANCASLSDDLIEKSRIIENYIIEKGHIDKTSPARHSSSSHGGSSDGKQSLSGLKNKMRDFIKQDELSNKDVNKRLQNMLEETLTKNIQLQKDVDWLSAELSKLQPSSQG